MVTSFSRALSNQLNNEFTESDATKMLMKRLLGNKKQRQARQIAKAARKVVQ